MDTEKEFEQRVTEYKSILIAGYDSKVFGYIVKSIQYLFANKKIKQALELSTWAKIYLSEICKKNYNGSLWDLESYCLQNGIRHEFIEYMYAIYKLESYDKFESFIFYLEKNRAQEKRFYLPRMGTLKYVVRDLEELEYGDLLFYGLSMPSRTGKSTICILFLLWVMMRRPNSHNAMGGHSGILAKGFYKELLNFVISSEYTFGEMYEFHHPGKMLLRDKSADEYTITLDEPDRFATITCRGADGTWTGAVDVSSDGYLYIDDLVRDRQHSLSPRRMEETFQDYLNKMVDRLNDGSKQLMVGTLWNVLDPLERLRVKYDGDPRYRFRKIPALNEKDESNFQYTMGKGFSTDYYRKMRDILDDAEWMAKYQQKPYRREGLLFPPTELNYFNGILPEGDSRVVSVCDVAFGGGDYLSMPIGREYPNGDVYIFDWVFNNGPKEVTIPVVVGKIIANEITSERFEANNGGDLYCERVDKMLHENGYVCNCTHKKAPNTMEKSAKIEQYSGDIKRKFYFLGNCALSQKEREEDAKNGVTRYARSQDYQKAMDWLADYVTIGKNDHDDAPDSLTQLAMLLEKKEGNAVTVTNNPFSW